MKRIKFKKQSDLTKHAIRRIVLRQNTEAIRMTAAIEANKPDFLEMARRKAKGLR